MIEATAQNNDKWFLATEVPDLEERRIDDRFRAMIVDLIARKPGLEAIMEVVGNLDWRMTSGQQALVKAGLREDFDVRTMNEIAALRVLMSLLQLILDNEGDVFAVLQRAKQRRR